MSVDSRHRRIRDLLLGWYQAQARVLPWRIPPGSAIRPDPYRVWLSEIMLQQTTVAAVIPYFELFVGRWPTIAALAAADPAEVLAAWAGLGYYSRARSLIACAGIVVRDHGGAFPADEAALLGLPGIGPYTAAAIAAIAFGARAVPIDANVERVVARLEAIVDPLPAGRPVIRAAADRLWPSSGAGDFAQAMMDLGARICIARTPRCTECPLAEMCRARAAGMAATIPVKPAKQPRPERHGTARWIVRGSGADAAVWLVRRPPKGLLGGMRALPGTDWSAGSGGSGQPAAALGTVRHIFTHFALTLSIVRGRCDEASGEGEWWPLSRLDAAGLPTLYRRAAKMALEEDGNGRSPG